MTKPRRQPADYCEYLPTAVASRATRRHPWYSSWVQGQYLVLERDEWEARGAGYRWKELRG